jgi:hypothetical protein
MENLKANDSAPSGRGFSRHSGVYRPMTLFLPKINEGCQGQPRTKRLSSTRRGLEVKLLFSTSGRGRNIFLDIPLYRTGDFTSLRRFFAF